MQPDHVIAFKAFWLILKFFQSFNIVICAFVLGAASVSLIYLLWYNAIPKSQYDLPVWHDSKENHYLSPIKEIFYIASKVFKGVRAI